MVGPSRQQSLQDARRSALAHGDAARYAYDVWDFLGRIAEEGVSGFVQLLCRVNVKIQQARQRQVNIFDLAERDSLIDAAQLRQIILAQSQRGGIPQPAPFFASQVNVR